MTLNSRQKLGVIFAAGAVLGAIIGALTIDLVFYGRPKPPNANKTTAKEAQKSEDDEDELAAETAKMIEIIDNELAKELLLKKGVVEKTGDAIDRGPKTIKVKISGTLYESVAAAAGEKYKFEALKSDVLAAQIKRLLVWELPENSDFYPGDELMALFEETDANDDGIKVQAVRYESKKRGRSVTAYLFQKKDDRFERYYDKDGTLAEKWLNNAPLRDWEQITSLVGDGRGHKGIDFKAPVGEPVYLPFKAKVLKRNWNVRVNGNCLQLAVVGKDMKALFLHLNSTAPKTKIGATLEAGTMIGTVGNTGRSSAAHLHYQLDVGKKPIDPFKVHGFSRKKLSGKDLQEFLAKGADYEKLLETQ